MRIKKLLSPLFRFLPFIILIGILIYLGSVNSISEVYIDLISTKMSFVIEEETDELISNISVDSLQLRNSDLKLRLGKIFNILSEKDISTSIKQLHITRNDETVDSQIELSRQNRMVVKNLSVPIFARIDVIKEDSTIRIELLANSNLSEKSKGKIYVGGTFLFTGRNIKISGLNQYSDYDLLSISTHRIYKSVTFVANDKNVTIILYMPSDEVNISKIIKNLYVRNISFVETDHSKRKNKEKSTILSGSIQIAGIDFFGKRFLIKEERLDKNDFLDIADRDEYFISSVSLAEQGFKISISSEEATELEKGKRIRLLRSIFPSMLDFIIAEPSKKTFWTILVFVLTQFTILRKTLKRYFKKDKSDK